MEACHLVPSPPEEGVSREWVYKNYTRSWNISVKIGDGGCEYGTKLGFSSVQFSRSVMSDSLRPHESQDARPPCSSPTPGIQPNRQIWPWNMEWSRAKANRVLPREHTGHSKLSYNNTTEDSTLDITRWSTSKSDWLYSLQPKMKKLYTVSKNKTRSWL